MNDSKSHILEEIQKLMPDTKLKQDKVITSGKLYYGWVKDRLIWDTQVIVNAVKCNEDDLGDVIKKIEFQLTEEFRTFVRIKPVVFTYTDMTLLNDVVSGVIEHFGSQAAVEDMLQDTSKDAEKVAGCIILTAMPLPKIGS